jgi:hypothetical protein
MDVVLTAGRLPSPAYVRNFLFDVLSHSLTLSLFISYTLLQKRVDYIFPSTNVKVVATGVFWPESLYRDDNSEIVWVSSHSMHLVCNASSLARCVVFIFLFIHFIHSRYESLSVTPYPGEWKTDLLVWAHLKLLLLFPQFTVALIFFSLNS